MPLLSVRTMPTLNMQDQDNEIPAQPGVLVDDSEAVNFDAEAHTQLLEEVYNIFNIHLHEWVVCRIGDNSE